MNECRFCQPLTNVLWETENFLLVTEEYPVTEGTILVISKRHINCMAEMSVEEYDEFNKISQKIRRFFKKCYKKNLVWFEHGAAGQTINHAHAHFLPLAKSLIRKIVSDNGNPNETEYFEQWKQFYEKNGKYYLFNQFDSFFLFEPRVEKNGYFRHLVAKALDRGERADWRNYENKNRVKQIDSLVNNWKKWIVLEKK